MTKPWDLRKIGNFNQSPQMLGIDWKVLNQPPKGIF